MAGVGLTTAYKRARVDACGLAETSRVSMADPMQFGMGIALRRLVVH